MFLHEITIVYLVNIEKNVVLKQQVYAKVTRQKHSNVYISSISHIYIIEIKICIEYPDMVWRPRQIC